MSGYRSRELLGHSRGPVCVAHVLRRSRDIPASDFLASQTPDSVDIAALLYSPQAEIAS